MTKNWFFFLLVKLGNTTEKFKAKRTLQLGHLQKFRSMKKSSWLYNDASGQHNTADAYLSSKNCLTERWKLHKTGV